MRSNVPVVEPVPAVPFVCPLFVAVAPPPPVAVTSEPKDVVPPAELEIVVTVMVPTPALPVPTVIV